VLARSRTLRAGGAGAAAFAGGILDCRSAPLCRKTGRDKGWSLSIEQRDAALDLN